MPLRVNRPTVLLVLGGLALAHIAFAVVFWETTWDDSAITLAHARTLALHGRIAPTPLSEPVEGYSTTLWLLLHAALAPLVGTPGALLATAKGLGLGLNLVAIILTYALARRFAAPALALAVTVVFGTLSITWVESVNGMETPLLVALYLTAFLTYRRSGRAYGLFVVASSLFLLVRWEAAWYLVPFVIAGVLDRGWRGFFRPEHLTWAAVFAGTSLWRRAYFGAWVPNTILAKAHPPYSGNYPLPREILEHLQPFVLVGLALGPLLVGVAAAWRLGVPGAERRRTLRAFLRSLSRDPLRLAGLIVLATVVFNLAIGQNWGPKNRMFYLAFPFVLVLLGTAFERASRTAPEARRARLRVVLAVSVALNAALGLAWASDAQRRERITVGNIGAIAEAAEAVRLAAGREQMTYAAPDMGALLLFHGEHLRVLDLALLCNPLLAREGYEAVPAYLFERERPALIETHWRWTPLTGLPEAEALLRDYVPLFSNGFRFFARRDLVEAIPPERLRAGRFDDAGDASAYRRDHFVYRVHLPEDFALNRAFGAFVELVP